MDKKVTITFDSFEDFKRFLENPPRIRLNQIAVEQTAHYSEVPKPSPVVPAAQPQFATIQEAIVATLSSSREGRPMTIAKLAAKALVARGMRRTKRNLHNVRWHVGQMTGRGELTRLQRGVYTLPSAKKARKG
jgi:hypothetical protein